MKTNAPTSTVENYLKAIYMLKQRTEGSLVVLGALAETLGVTPGTVTTMVKNLAEAGYADYETRRGVTLTNKGEQAALHVLRRHRLVELFLVEVVGLDWAQVHDDAEVLEHVISDTLLERIDEMLGHPTVDPHGDPIPAASGKIHRRKLAPLADAPTGRVEIARITDHAPDFLRFLRGRGLTPGAQVAIVSRDDAAEVITVQLDDKPPFALGMSAAHKILIDAG